MKDRTPDRILRWVVAILLVVVGAQAQAQPSGPTLDEPFHMPTLTDTSTLDVVVVEPWHVDTINGTTRQKLINIHVDDWWPGVEIRVPVRLVVPLQGSVQGFVITGARLEGTGEGDKAMTASDEVALDGGVGVVMTKIKSLPNYPELSSLPTQTALRNRFLQEDLDLRYSEVYMWGAVMMRAITAAFDDDLFLPGPVIAYGNSKNGITPLVSSIHDERIVAVRSTRAFTALTPIRTNDPLALAEVAAADSDYDAAVAAGLPQGDQPWPYYYKAYRSNAGLLDDALAFGWSEAEVQASLDRVADDMYVSENWDELVARGVSYFSLPGSHDWVAYDVPGTATILPNLRTYIVPNGGHGRPGHPEAPSDSVDAAFFAEQLFGADGGLEIPEIATVVSGDTLEVTVTFPDGGVPEDSRIFWMYEREPDGSSWYLYDLFPEDNWTTMSGAGSTVTASIPLEPGRTSIDLITTHTVTVGGNSIPISAPYTRVALGNETLANMVDNFDGGNTTYPWTENGTWYISGETYNQDNITAYKQAYAGNPAWTDYTYTADMITVSNADPAAGSYANSLAFRVSDNKNLYFARLKTDGELELRKRVGGATTLIASVPTGYSPFVWQNYKIVVAGESIQVSINDDLLIDASDSDHASGAIGIRTSRSSTSVDNVRVTQPAGC
ncbi:family 16 glycoside hydrolase [Candidatus Marimicrobium litorale]|uniref:3-keto-alpha-glucoside-1,2-lyase/3-keto-2-hydroxy-glucal hydratase domain-containing protein n=1 Tax=Candidatus Marimicrobium litorale TaxID=2518991 RepID=A0ABT3T936_9GAMM|nr:family 16 glycoside hydrolase [Candidatus Marimicrobium litorale]MCX2978775.1 hypothetical protein [Candidatus Marimicrobium litorale]